MEALRRRIALLVTAGLTAAVLSACATGPQYVPVDIRDSGASAVSVRAEWHPRTQANGSGGMEVKDGIEAQYVRMQGSEDQTLQTGQTVSVGGQSITGPALVSHRLEISYAHIAYGGTAPVITPDFELDAFMGAGRVDFDLRSSVTTPAALTLHANEVDYGLSMGLGLRWWFITNTGVEGRLIILTQNPLSFFGGTFGEGGQTDMLASELALVVSPGKHVAFRAGYATMDLTPERSSGSSLDFGLRGPFLGLGITF